MGEFGPLRQVGSVRDLRENGGKPTEIIPERPLKPAWCKGKVAKEFDTLCDKLTASGVPTKAADGQAVAQVAQMIIDYGDARSPQERARIGRDLFPALDAIGATPKGRLRMGVRGQKKQESRAAQLVKMAKTVNGQP